MYKSPIILLLLLVFLCNIHSLSAQTTPDVVFKIIRGGQVLDELYIPDLPAGATLAHKGEGVFHIYGLPASPSNYSFKLKAEGDLRDGVSTQDFSLIERHIMGNGSISNPNDLLAADVNCDGRINVFDLINLRRVIISDSAKFGCRTNYKFNPATIDFEWLGTTIEAGDIIPIKIGDVNGSTYPNSSGKP